MRKRIILTAVAIMFGGVLGLAGVADAHTSSASMTCQGGLVIDGVRFRADLPNHVYWKIDGGTPGQQQFGDSVHKTVANPDKTVPHIWQVQFTAGDGTQFDHFMSGSIEACQVAPTTTTVTPTTTTVPATTTTGPRTGPTTTVVAAATTSPATTVAGLPTVPVQAVPVVTVPSAAPIVHPQLPGTGSPSGVLFAISLALIAAGAALLFIRRGARRI